VDVAWGKLADLRKSLYTHLTRALQMGTSPFLSTNPRCWQQTGSLVSATTP